MRKRVAAATVRDDTYFGVRVRCMHSRDSKKDHGVESRFLEKPGTGPGLEETSVPNRWQWGQGSEGDRHCAFDTGVKKPP